MRIILPALALLAASLGGCSSLSDITGAFSPSAPPERVASANDSFMRASPLAAPVEAPQHIRPSTPRILPVAEEPATTEDVIPNDAADTQVEPVSRKTVIRPIAADPEIVTPAAAPAGRMRFNVAAARDQINAYRDSEGLPPLAMDPALMRAAKQQSDAMAKSDSMDHSIGGSFAARMAKVGIEEVPAAENIAAGYANASAVIKGWQASPAHDANLKMKDATRLGIAAAPSPSQPQKIYWTLIVAGE
jgi:uncharacterized protein YkwD